MRRALTWHCDHRGDGHYRSAEGYKRAMCCRPTEARCPTCRRAICPQHLAEHQQKRHAA